MFKDKDGYTIIKDNDLGVYSEQIDVMLDVANRLFCASIVSSWSTWQQVKGYNSATLVKHSSRMNMYKLLNIRRTILTCKAIWALAKNILKLEDNEENRMKYYREGLRFYITISSNSTWYREFKEFLKNEKKNRHII